MRNKVAPLKPERWEIPDNHGMMEEHPKQGVKCGPADALKDLVGQCNARDEAFACQNISPEL